MERELSELDGLAVRAAAEPAALEELVARCERDLLQIAARATHRFVTKSDDEWSVALAALLGAVQSYTPEKGSFRSFYELLVRRRLVDHYRAQSRFANEVSVAPEAFDEPPDDESDQPAAQSAVLEKVAAMQDGQDLHWEIAAAAQIFANYGFRFWELADCSPHAQKTRRACALAVGALLQNPILLAELRRTGTVPIKPITDLTGLPRKILERHRKYIIAATEILSGEFPGLQEYMRFIREELKP